MAGGTSVAEFLVRQEEDRLRQDELLRRKRRLLDDWEAREREWEAHREEELRWLRNKETQLRSQETRVTEAERIHDERLRELDEHFARKKAATDEQRKRMTELLEQTLRAEVEETVTPEVIVELQNELGVGIAEEVRLKLRGDFDRMCAAMKGEVDRARAHIRDQLEQTLRPQVEAALHASVCREVEAEVQEEMLATLRSASEAAHQLRVELQSAADERDRARAETEEISGAHRRAVESLTAEAAGSKAQTEAFREQIGAEHERLAALVRERQAYPILAGVPPEQLPAGWMDACRSISEARGERGRLTTEIQFARQEAAALRERKPVAGREGCVSPVTGVGAELLASLRSQTPKKNGVQSPSTPARRRPPGSASRTPRTPSGPSARDIPAKDRFRHTPRKVRDQPTFPLAKADSDRVFFKEMELIVENTPPPRRRAR
eukprot:Hpha_TRINITY_DN15235_c5_g2::TRINITY_DN15235_c5_g2_i1::g.67892::m.67892